MKTKLLVFLTVGALLILLLPSSIVSQTCCVYRGDVDHSGGPSPVNVADLTYLVAFLFDNGASPPCAEEADVNASGGPVPITVTDVTYLVELMFVGGPDAPSCELPPYIPIVLNFGETGVVGPPDVELTFLELLSDSRCPTTVFCFWEGVAEIGLVVVPPGWYPVPITLPITGGVIRPQGAMLLPVDCWGLRFTMLSLLPYPVTTDPIPDTAYATEILVEQLEPAGSLNSDVYVASNAWVQGNSAGSLIDSIALTGDTLDIWLTYSGGCFEHYFTAYMHTGSSYPHAANLFLQEAPDEYDPCDAIISEHVRYSLAAVIERMRPPIGPLEPFTIYLGGESVVYTPPAAR